jgi:hypothetical protein
MEYFTGINLQLVDCESTYTPLWQNAQPRPYMGSEDDDDLSIKLAQFRIN